MMVRIDQTRQNDVARRVNNLGTTSSDVRLDGHDMIAFDEDVSGNEIVDIVIHRYDGAALEESAFGVRHGVLRFARLTLRSIFFVRMNKNADICSPQALSWRLDIASINVAQNNA